VWPGAVWPGAVWPGAVWPGAVWPGAVGIALGAASFAADLADGTLREVLQFVASTGFAWGCAAFAVAVFAETRRGAAGAAVAVGGTPPRGV
jgi:hypothetical protein